jgi:ABC-type cobalamin transport system permease subunit
VWVYRRTVVVVVVGEGLAADGGVAVVVVNENVVAVLAVEVIVAGPAVEVVVTVVEEVEQRAQIKFQGNEFPGRSPAVVSRATIFTRLTRNRAITRSHL